MKSIKDKLKELHQEENLLNKEICKIDKSIYILLKRKKKLASLVSKNMKYRNLLISKLVN